MGTHLRLPPSPLHWGLHPLLASEAISVRLGLIENAATLRRVVAISPVCMLVVNELLRGERCRRLAVEPTKGHLTLLRRPFDKFWLHLDILRLHMAPSVACRKWLYGRSSGQWGMSVAAPIVLRPGDESKLRTVLRCSTAGAGVAQRARIVLLAAEGVSNAEIGRRVGCRGPRCCPGVLAMSSRASRGSVISTGRVVRR